MHVVLHQEDVRRGLPALCPVTGLPTAETRRVLLVHLPGWVYLTGLVGLLPFFVAYFVLARRIQFALPVAPGLLATRRRYQRMRLACVAGAGFSPVLAFVLGSPVPLGAGVALAGAAFFLTGRISPTGPRLRYDGTRVTFADVHHNFRAVTARDALPA